MTFMLFVGVVDGSGAGPRDRPNARAFSTTGQRSDRRSARGPDADSPGGINVAFVPDPPAVPALMMMMAHRGCRGHRRRSQHQTQAQNHR